MRWGCGRTGCLVELGLWGSVILGLNVLVGLGYLGFVLMGVRLKGF